MKKTILVVAAHPDDEILGCGGTVARFCKEGYAAYTLILGEGIAARGNGKDVSYKKEEIRRLKEQADSANRIIGVKKVFMQSFPDNRFDTVPLLDIVKAVEKVAKEINPDIIFTHYSLDLNIDHRITYDSVITAARPLSGNTVKEIYSFEVLSSTEWNSPASFIPDTFINIKDTMDTKLKALRQYKSELMPFPHPRSLKGAELNARYWGMRINSGFTEAFKNVRRIF